jgi:hypothetical protein
MFALAGPGEINPVRKSSLPTGRQVLSNRWVHTRHSPRKRWRSGLNAMFAEKEQPSSLLLAPLEVGYKKGLLVIKKNF